MTATATLTGTVGRPTYDHLLAMTDEVGVFEHALGNQPRPEHGYCVDDVARALVVAVREPRRTRHLDELEDTCLAFLRAAAHPDGRSHNRRSLAGQWTDAPTVGDWWGRSLWALGSAAARATRGSVRDAAAETFALLATRRSPDVRAMVFAALGAAELVGAGNRQRPAMTLLRDAVGIVPTRPVADWAWPEPRLRYANGALPEALIRGGAALGDDRLARSGIRLLEALVGIETHDGRISVTGNAGRGPAETGAQFDQQPIEVAAIADAAASALEFTAGERWRSVVGMCWAWFTGSNDSGVPMVDSATGAGYDGLEPDGRNDNRGAESTLAALSTWQQAERLGVLS